MLKPTSCQVADDLYLVRHPLSVAAAPPPNHEPTDHVAVIDCSGSMYAELPRIRQQLKAKWPTLTAEGDTFTLIWFSGRGQSGILLDAVEPSIRTQAGIDRAVDKLVPMGLTGFYDPLALVEGALLRRKGRASLFFMSDGYNNDASREDVLRLCASLGGKLSASTMVGYGYYADPLLAKMAERSGGTLITATDFDDYEPTFEKALRRRGAAKKQSAIVSEEPVGGFVFAVDGDALLTFATDEIHQARRGPAATTTAGFGADVPAHLGDVFYLSSRPVGTVVGFPKRDVPSDDVMLSAAYAATSLYAQRIQPRLVWSLLRKLGDVRLIDEFSICFGKQRYAAFVATTQAAAFGDGRFVRGFDPARAPKEDAFTVLDLFDLLAGTEGCRVLTGTDAFVYSRIGRKSVDKGDMLTVKESADLAKHAEQMAAGAGAREVKPLLEILAAMQGLLCNRKRALRFKADADAAERGYGIEGLVWNETMPNLSFRVRIPGSVDLAGEDVPDEVRRALPQIVSTYMYRTYTVVKDGLVHVEWLPVVVTRAAFDVLVACGVVDPAVDACQEVAGGVRVVVDMRKLPVVNQRMVNGASARLLAEKVWRLHELKAAAKVWKYYTPERTSAGFATVYGAVAAKWLDEHGVTDHSGFKIESTAAPPVDFYIGRALDVKVPGFSSLPSVEDVRDRMASEAAAAEGTLKGKVKAVNAPGRLMVPALQEVDAFLASDIYQKAANKDALFARWVEDKSKSTVAETRKLQTEIAKQKFAVLLSSQWFCEFSSWDENKLKLTLGGEVREVTFALDEAVKISQ